MVGVARLGNHMFSHNGSDLYKHKYMAHWLLSDFRAEEHGRLPVAKYKTVSGAEDLFLNPNFRNGNVWTLSEFRSNRKVWSIDREFYERRAKQSLLRGILQQLEH